MSAMRNPDRDRGGRILPKKKWRVFNFVIEVAVESPGSIDEAEANEDAAEFVASVSRAQGRVHESFCHITRIDEVRKRPKGASVHNNVPIKVTSKKAKKTEKARPQKKTKKKRY